MISDLKILNEYNKIDFSITENQELFMETKSDLGYGYSDDWVCKDKPLTDLQCEKLAKEIIKRHKRGMFK